MKASSVGHTCETNATVSATVTVVVGTLEHAEFKILPISLVDGLLQTVFVYSKYLWSVRRLRQQAEQGADPHRCGTRPPDVVWESASFVRLAYGPFPHPTLSPLFTQVDTNGRPWYDLIVINLHFHQPVVHIFSKYYEMCSYCIAYLFVTLCSKDYILTFDCFWAVIINYSFLILVSSQPQNITFTPPVASHMVLKKEPALSRKVWNIT